MLIKTVGVRVRVFRKRGRCRCVAVAEIRLTGRDENDRGGGREAVNWHRYRVGGKQSIQSSQGVRPREPEWAEPGWKN